MKACKQFYAFFDVFPQTLYVSVQLSHVISSTITLVTRQDPLELWFTTLPPEEQAKPIKTVDHHVKVLPNDSLSGEQFFLYHEQIGQVYPEQLIMSAQALEMIIQARGYRVDIFPKDEHMPYWHFIIRKGQRAISWVFADTLFDQPMWMVKQKLEERFQILERTGTPLPSCK